jgi:hypothetical protein
LKPVSAYLDLTVSGLVGEREFAAAAALVPSKRDLVAFLSK